MVPLSYTHRHPPLCVCYTAKLICHYSLLTYPYLLMLLVGMIISSADTLSNRIPVPRMFNQLPSPVDSSQKPHVFPLHAGSHSISCLDACADHMVLTHI